MTKYNTNFLDLHDKVVVHMLVYFTTRKKIIFSSLFHHSFGIVTSFNMILHTQIQLWLKTPITFTFTYEYTYYVHTLHFTNFTTALLPLLYYWLNIKIKPKPNYKTLNMSTERFGLSKYKYSTWTTNIFLRKQKD